MIDEEYIEYVADAANIYIDNIVKSTFRKMGHEADPSSFYIRWIIIKDPMDNLVMYPLVVKCKYERIKNKILLHLLNHMYKDIGIHYKRVPAHMLRYPITFDEYDHIDVNFSEAGFIVTDDNGVDEDKYLCIYDSDPAKVSLRGEVIPSYRYEKLLLKWKNIDVDTYRQLEEKCRSYSYDTSLPDQIHRDWKFYHNLFVDAFGIEPGDGYEFICGPGVKRMEVNKDGKES